MSVTHIAGPVAEIGDRKIQRCIVCGEKLEDNFAILSGMVASVGSAPPKFLSWEVGCLVQVDGNRRSTLAHDDGTNLPDDSCIDLVEGN